MLQRFFLDYKTLEGKAVEVEDFKAAHATMGVINEALERYSELRRRGFKRASKASPKTGLAE